MCGSRPFRAWKGAIVSVLGPRGRMQVALAVLIVAVGALAAVVAQDQSTVSAIITVPHGKG